MLRTIDTILRYKFTPEQIETYLDEEIINWCWGKWGFNFSKTLEDNIELFDSFDKWKAKELFEDIKALCYEHDYDFFVWWGYFKFYLANFYFARWLFKLTHWASFVNRISIFMIAFVLLSRYGKKYFDFTKR